MISYCKAHGTLVVEAIFEILAPSVSRA